MSNAVITASAHLNVKDEFYQPPRTPQKQGRSEGSYTFIFLQKMNEKRGNLDFTSRSHRLELLEKVD